MTEGKNKIKMERKVKEERNEDKPNKTKTDEIIVK